MMWKRVSPFREPISILATFFSKIIGSWVENGVWMARPR